MSIKCVRRVCVWKSRYSSILSRCRGDYSTEHDELWQRWGFVFLASKKEKKIKQLGIREGEKKMRWYKENGRKAAHTNTRSFKPQKLFRATNSFYKANCALIPVISKTEGRKAGWGGEMARESSCLWRWIAVIARCFFYLLTCTHTHPRCTLFINLQVEQ